MIERTLIWTLRHLVRCLFRFKSLNMIGVMMDVLYTEHKRRFFNVPVQGRYAIMRSNLDNMFRLREKYYGKHPQFDNRAN
jgi:hypothetical protein